MATINFGSSDVSNDNFSRNNRGIQLSPKAGAICMLLFGAVFAVVGVFLVRDAEQTRNWPTTSGTAQEVSSLQTRDSDGSTRTQYEYVVVYTVDGTSYRSRASSSGYVANGQAVKVAYNTQNPNDIRVNGGPTWLGWIFAGIGVIVFLIGLFSAIRAFGSSSKSPSAPPQSLSGAPPIAPTPPTTEQIAPSDQPKP